MSKRPTIFLDTNIFSALHYFGSSVSHLSRRDATRSWWKKERAHFELYTSMFAERELLRGIYKGQDFAITEARRVNYLPRRGDVLDCAHYLLEQHIVPERQGVDAIQLAYSIIYRVDYLLTWNYAHLANPDVQLRLQRLCDSRGWRASLLVSPETIPWVSYGREIERPDE